VAFAGGEMPVPVAPQVAIPNTHHQHVRSRSAPGNRLFDRYVVRSLPERLGKALVRVLPMR